MSVTKRGLLIGFVLIAVLAVITLDHYRQALRDLRGGRLRREASEDVVETDPRPHAPYDPDGETELVIRLGGFRIPRVETPPSPDPDSPEGGNASHASSGPGSPTGPATGEDPSGGKPTPSDPGPKPPTDPDASPPLRFVEIEHVVGEGETLGAIAIEYFESYDMWKSIAEWNGISDPRSVRAGQTLVIRVPERGRTTPNR